MKAIIPIERESMHSQIGNRFARSPFFLICDRKTNHVEIIENPFQDTQFGAGNQLVKLLLNKNIQQIIAPDLGVKIQQRLFEHKIQIILLQKSPRNVKEILIKMKQA